MSRFNTGNPLDSDDLRDLSDNAKNVDIFSNDRGSSSYIDRFGATRMTVHGMERDFKEAVIGAGYIYHGDYSKGLVITGYNQIVRDDKGEFWRVSGTRQLPYTLTGSGVDEGGALVGVGDAALRGDLSTENGASLIGFDVDNEYPDNSIGGAIKGIRSKNLTNIRDSLKRISVSFNGIASKPKVVITGDSLSFNAFGYPSGWPVSGSGYATDNPFGLSSWAHLLRDVMAFASPAFTPASELVMATDAKVSYVVFSNAHKYGLNQRPILLDFTNNLSGVAKIKHPYSGNKSLVFSYAPAADAVSFKVDGVSYNNKSPDGKYQGGGYFFVNCKSDAVISDVSPLSGSGNAILPFYGAHQREVSVPYLTGKGGYTSGQILGEINSLVSDYDPDCIIYIIGANDLALSDPSEFNLNVREFVSLSKSKNPSCEILLISQPPSDTGRDVIPFVKVLSDISREVKGVSFIDLYHSLIDLSPSFYRYDNIHFNKNGDDLVFNIVKDLAFKSLIIDQDKLSPVREAMLGVGGWFYTKPPLGRASFLLTLDQTITSKKVSSGWDYIDSPKFEYKGEGSSSRVNITPPLGCSVDSVQAVSVGGVIDAQITAVGTSDNPLAFTVGISIDGKFVDLINTGKYLLVNFSG